MIDRESRGAVAGGIRKLRPGRRKISTIWITSDSDVSQIAESCFTEVGRRMPRGSEKVSVRALKIAFRNFAIDLGTGIEECLLGVQR